MAVPTANPPDRVIAGTVNNSQFHDSGFQEFQCPANAPLWWVGTGKRDELGLACSIEDALSGRSGRMLAGQDGLETFLHQLLPGPGNRVDAGIQGGGDLPVTPSFAGLGSIGFQQDARPHQLTCTVFALMDQRVEPFALLVAELHDVLLHASLFRGHDASPSLRSHRFRGSHQNQRHRVVG